jgi:long-chain acyl-CoA synthetase
MVGYPYRALWSNYEFAMTVIGRDHIKPGANTLSILPMAHMYGMAFEFIFEFLHGCHIFYLTRVPSPAIIAQAFADIRPAIIIAVPLVIEKIIKKKVFPKIQNNRMRLLLNMPVISKKVKEKICEQVVNAFGGNFYEVIIGGAAFSKDVEHFLHQIHFPYTVGYGMTECAPIIAYAPWDKFREGSVGKAIERMQIRIDSDNPYRKVGEIQVKGINTMLGYYRNEEATKEAFTDDGWLKTGDLGVLDQDGYLYIRGRSKNMILGPNGQNIYPEEIEDQINSLPYVAESLVVSRKNNLVALVHPDLEKMDAEKMSMTDVRHNIQISITQLNQDMPTYCKISSFQIYEDEFEKTPKHSIKRFLYK